MTEPKSKKQPKSTNIDKTQLEIDRFNELAQINAVPSVGLGRILTYGGVVAAGGFLVPTFGIAAAAGMVLLHFIKSQRNAYKAVDAIEYDGAIAPFLSPDQLKAYGQIVGRDIVEQEFQAASKKVDGIKIDPKRMGKLPEQGEADSSTVLAYKKAKIDEQHDALKIPGGDSDSTRYDFTEAPEEAKTRDLDLYTQQTVGALQRLVKDPKSALLVAPSGAGKTVVVYHYCRGFKKAYPDSLILVLDLKDQQGESEFWERGKREGFFDEVYRINPHQPKEEAAGEALLAVREFRNAVKYNPHRPVLIFIDECIVVASTAKHGGKVGQQFQSELYAFADEVTAAGHSERNYLLMVSQVSQDKALPVESYTRNQTRRITLIRQKSDLDIVNGSNPKIVPTEKSNPTDIDETIAISDELMQRGGRPAGKGRALYISDFESWYPMIPLEVVSATDRDIGQYAGADAPQPEPEPQPSPTPNPEPPAPPSPEPKTQTVDVDAVPVEQPTTSSVEHSQQPTTPPSNMGDKLRENLDPKLNLTREELHRLDIINRINLNTESKPTCTVIYDTTPRNCKPNANGETMKRSELTTWINHMVDQGYVELFHEGNRRTKLYRLTQQGVLVVKGL